MKVFALSLSVVLLVAGCVAGPRPLPDALPDAFSSLGNPVLADPAVPGQFEVVGIPGLDPMQYWCAAGEYAANRLGQYNARLYVVRPEGPSETRPRARSVVFTLRPDVRVLAAANAPRDGNLSLMIRAVGDNYLATAAESTCEHVIPPFPDLSNL
ncbi:hypothetical protein [Pontitalea aquivivens]|uniref:hypothetical protein n=1 Tax=Pontitalea aquivivens TaxID=3388663 RepID=UPI003970DB0E